MAPSVEIRSETLEIRAHDLVQFDEEQAHFSIPYEAVQRVRTGPYTAPAGTFALANRQVAYADVKAGHFKHGQAWTFAAFDDPAKTVIVDLVDFDYALRPYDRIVVEVADPDATASAILAHVDKTASELDSQGQTAIAWTGLTTGTPVVSSDGASVGTVSHILGDLDEDLFEGIALRTQHGATRMVAAADIARMTDESVTLSLSSDACQSLPPVVLEDLREAVPGKGIFRRGPHWKKESNWREE